MRDYHKIIASFPRVMNFDLPICVNEIEEGLLIQNTLWMKIKATYQSLFYERKYFHKYIEKIYRNEEMPSD